MKKTNGYQATQISVVKILSGNSNTAGDEFRRENQQVTEISFYLLSISFHFYCLFKGI